MLSEASPIVINNSLNAFDDDNTFTVPIIDLVFTSKRKLRNKTMKKKRLNTDACNWSTSACSTRPSTSAGPGRCPPTPLMTGGDPKPAVDHEFIVNRNPELATAWTKHRAIGNYENFHNINVDLSETTSFPPLRPS